MGPTLFLIIINDLPNASSMSSILFAYDTTLSFSHPNYDVLIDVANAEMNNIVELMECNKLTINVDETNSMIFTNKVIGMTIL